MRNLSRQFIFYPEKRLFIYLLYMVVFLTIGVIVGMETLLWNAILLCFASLIILINCKESYKRRELFILFGCCFIITEVLAVFNAYSNYDLYGNFLIPGKDADTYFIQSKNVALHWLGYIDEYDFIQTYGGYVYTLAILNSINLLIFGKASLFSLLFVTCFFGSLACTFIYLIIDFYLKNRASAYFKIIVSFNGILLFFSSFLLRDMIIVFFVVYVTYLLALTSEKKLTGGQWFFACLSLILLAFYRIDTAALLLSMISLDIFLKFKFSWIAKLIILLLCAGLIVFYFDAFGLISRHAESFNRLMLVENASQNSLAFQFIYGRESFIANVFRLFYALFMPVPPFISKCIFCPETLVFIGAVSWYLLIPSFILNVWQVLYYRRKDMYFLVFFASTFIILSLIIPMGLRYKLQFFPAMLIVASLQGNSSKFTKITYLLYLFLLIFMCFAYFLIKYRGIF